MNPKPVREKSIAYLHWGSAYQLRSFQDFSHYIDEQIYLGDLGQVDLNQFAAIIVADAMDSVTIAAHARQLNNYVRNGGFLIVFFQGNADWIDVVPLNWRPHTTKDWLWWMKPGQRLEIHQPEPSHPICDHIPLSNMSWHWGGAYALDKNGQSILNLDEGDASLFLDFRNIEGGGRLMVSTLDPHSHNGQRFMPATTRFLQGFYPWLNRELGIERPKRNRFTYLQCTHNLSDWRPPWIETSLTDAGFDVQFCPLYALDEAVLSATDYLYLPANHDEVFLQRNQALLLDYLENGGNMIICAEPVTSWLPFISPFNAVSPRPFSNIKIRLRDDRPGFFAQMDDTFDGWQDVYGQYARGWSDMPPGAIWLTDVGPQHDPKPADWLWRYPAASGKGGFVFMHNGDSMIRYPDHGPHKEQLVRDICLGLQSLILAKQIL
ncbi:MAG: hypothetical protein P1V21_15105 [Rhizobiaceae bacterium]|nr:hypothetical protein [Rhizobiaceae bacterium]